MRTYGRGYLLVLIAAAAFSTSGLFIRWTVGSSCLTALSLAFWRDLATFLCLLLSLVLVRQIWRRSEHLPSLHVERRDLPWLVGIGVMGIGLFHVLWNLTILYLGYAVATVLLYSSPAFVTLMAWIFWREPLTRYKVAAILLVLAGCVLVAGREEVAAIPITAGGLLLGLVTAISCGMFTLLGRQVAPRYSPWTVLTYAFGVGALVLFPFQFAGPAPPWPLPAAAWIWFAGLILLATIVPFGALLAGLRWLPASVASIVLATEVALGAFMGYFFFGETLGPWQILGALLVTAGVSLIAAKANGGQSTDPV